MSSHREAPESSKDPAADNTDVYAFVSPDKPSTVTLIANFIPFQNPDGGPNFYAFGTDVLYEIHVFNTETYKTGNSYMYNTGTIGVDKGGAGDSKYPNLNRTQTYSVTKVTKSDGKSTVIGSNIPVPPCNIGIHSTPNYTKYVPPAIVKLDDGSTVFAGQRADPFFVDLGSVFDLADLRRCSSCTPDRCFRRRVLTPSGASTSSRLRSKSRRQGSPPAAGTRPS